MFLLIHIYVLKKKKEKTKTILRYFEHTAEQSTLEKTGSQELHYFYLLQQKGNKKVALQLAV